MKQDWQTIVATVVTTLVGALGTGGAIWKYIEYRQAQKKSERDSLTDSKRLEIERDKAEAEYDAKLIAALLEERKEQNVRIAALERQVTDERVYCETRLEAMRKDYNQQISDLRTELREMQKRGDVR